MRVKVRKLVIGVALVVAFTLLVLQPFLLPINAQTTTTLPSSSNTGVVESKDWAIKPELANGTVTINAPPEVIVAINNAQASATPAPFDQFINITSQQVENALGTDVGSYLWSQAESHDFLNVIFVNTSSGKPLYAWVQNFTPNWVAVWVKLPNGVPARGAVNITLEFTNASQYPYTGLAPYLTSTYGQYDNGQYVFPVYYNFAGTSLPQGLAFTVLSNPSGASGSYLVNNSLKITNVNGADFWGNDFMISLVYINKTFNLMTTPLLFETLITGIGGSALSATGWAKAGLVYMNNITTSSDSNGEVDMIVISQAEYAVQWQNGTSNIAPSAAWTGGSVSYPTVVAMLLNGSYVTGFYGSTLNNLVQPTSAVTPSGYKGVGYVGLFDTAHSSDTFWAFFQLLLARPWPPNGVMPAVVAVRGGYSSGPVAGQYIAWDYKPEGNTLNITIQVKNYTTGIHGFPGLVIYSANMGNFTNDNSTSGFSAILISFSGAVAYHSSDTSTYTFINTSAFPEPKPPFNMTVTLAKDSFGDTSVFKIYINKTAFILNVSLPLPWSQIGYIGLRADPDNTFTSTDPTVTAYNTTIGVTTTFTTTTTTTKTIANTTITSTTTTTTTLITTVTTTTTTTTTTTSTLTTTSTATATKVATTTTTSTVTSTVTTAVTTLYVTTTYVITSTVTVKSATSSGLSLSSIYVLVAIVTILVAIPAGILANRSTAQDSGRRYVQKA